MPDQKSTPGLRFIWIHQALKHVGISSGILDMSFIGNSICHLVANKADANEIEAILFEKQILIHNFDLSVDPEHLSAVYTEQQQAANKRHFVGRIAALANHAWFHDMAAGIIRELPAELMPALHEQIHPTC